MVRKTILMALISLILLIAFTIVQAEQITKDDVTIDPEDYESESFFGAEKGDKIKIKVTSDIPVNVYITAEYVYDNDFSDAKVSKEGTTSEDFTFTIPDDQYYYLYIYNPSNDTEAKVDYEYTDVFMENLEEAVEEAEGLFGFAVAICVGIIVIVVVVIVLIIYLITKGSKKDQPPQYPPGQYPPQPPPPPPPQQ